MKLIPQLTALSLVICASMIPLTAQARHNDQTQAIVMNNFNTEEQNLASQVNSYVANGQLSPQQGSAFSNELNQIASQAPAASGNSNATMMVMSELNSLSAQINASLGQPNQWAPVPVWGSVRGPGRYSWRPHWGPNHHTVAVQHQYQANQAAQQRQFQGHEAHARAENSHQIQANNAQENANVAHARSESAHQQHADKMVANTEVAHARAEGAHQAEASRAVEHASAAHAQAPERGHGAKEEHR